MTSRHTHLTMIAVVILATSACGGASATRSTETLPPLITSGGAIAPVVSALPVALVVTAKAQTQPYDRIRVVADSLKVDGYGTLRTAWAESDVWQHIADQAVTVLAPSDRSFQNLPHDLVRNMMAHREQVDALLTRHVLVGVYRYEQLAQLASVTGADGQQVAVFDYGKVLFDLG